MNSTISTDLQEHINRHRAALAPFFNAATKPNPSISFANDGTGFGKSFNVFDQFIEHAGKDGAGGHRNLFFITPQKAQIDIAKVTQQKAAKRGIKLLSFLAEQDLTDLEFNGWVTERCNSDLYRSWVRVLTGEYFQTSVAALKQAMERLEQVQAEERRFNQQGFSFFQSKEELDHQLKEARKQLLSALQKLATAVLREQNTPMAELLHPGNDKRDQVKAEIIDHLLPFERAKLEPTILLATSARFIHRASMVYTGRNGQPTIKKHWLTDILGGKRVPTDAESRDMPVIGSVCGLSHGQQLAYLKEHYFLTDENSYFRKHGISFNLVIDEEHESYKVFSKDSQSRMLSTDVKAPHVIAGLHRLLLAVQTSYPDGEETPIAYQETQELINTLRRHYQEDCTTSVSLDSILAMCADNVGHITIDNRDVEQILALSRNIFSLSPRHFYNEEALKQIRMRAVFGNSEIRLSLDDGSQSPDPTLYDFLQLMLCALFACAKIPEGSPLLEVLKLGANASQNAPLAGFIQSARKHREQVASLFERTRDSQIFIDAFFCYFVPKIVFSVAKVPAINFDDSVAKNRVFVDLQLELSRRLPEAWLLSVLYNTNNSVMCLSATSGFHNSYSGNFSRNMLALYGSVEPDNLGITGVRRDAADLHTMASLREARARARSCRIQPFYDSRKNLVSPLHEQADFKKTCRLWEGMLLNQVSDSPHRMAAFRRQIETLLIAAFDGKHTLALSLNNRFTRVFKSFFQQGAGLGRRGLKPLYEDKIFELKPFDGKSTVRVILFDAELAKAVDINHYLEVPEGTSVCLFSSYLSAGTGLNLIVRQADNGIEQDFDRLVLINSPFYSDIRPKGEGFNTLHNHILLLKHIAARPGHGLRLADFDSNLLKPDNQSILMREHDLALLKIIIQAVGRVERRDTHQETEIFLPDDLIEHITLVYSLLRREGNQELLGSLSLLNHRLLEFCLEQASRQSFATEQERQAFTQQVASSATVINDFFAGAYRKHILRSARNGDPEAIRFNELLRSPKSISAPQDYVQALLKSPLVKDSPYYQNVIEQFYLPTTITDKITVCISEESGQLTDLALGKGLYQPAQWVVPDYAPINSDSDVSEPAPNLINKTHVLARQGIAIQLPNPALLDLLKGNMGELIFSRILDQLDLQPLHWQEVVELLGAQAYERFDFYLQQQDSLICIDVKFWASTFANEQASRKVLSRAQEHQQLLDERCAAKQLTPRYLYVNTRHNHNALKVQSESAIGEPVYFLDAFKQVNSYRPHAYTNNLYQARDDLVINPSLIQLLRSTQ